MRKDPDTEKLLQLSGVIIWAGLALVFLQLAAQIVFSFGWWVKNTGGDLGSFYIGVVVLLIGAALMALLSFSSRVRNSRTSIFDSAITDTPDSSAGPVKATVPGHARSDASGGAVANAGNPREITKDIAKDTARDTAAAGGTLPSPSPSSSPP